MCSATLSATLCAVAYFSHLPPRSHRKTPKVRRYTTDRMPTLNPRPHRLFPVPYNLHSSLHFTFRKGNRNRSHRCSCPTPVRCLAGAHAVACQPHPTPIFPSTVEVVDVSESCVHNAAPPQSPFVPHTVHHPVSDLCALLLRRGHRTKRRGRGWLRGRFPTTNLLFPATRRVHTRLAPWAQ